MHNIDTIARAEVSVGEPGIAAAVLRGGEIIYQGCYGLADLEWEQPITPDTVFALGSLSKTFTALATVLAAQDGLLDLDAPVTQYLPGYPEAGRRVTIRHLLHHTSGVVNFVTQPSFANGGQRLDYAHHQLIALFSTYPLDFEPGTRYRYSNSGYRLLDIILEQATGMPFAELIVNSVFAPAGMRDARHLGNAPVVARRARGYQSRNNGFVNAEFVSSTVTGGAGGLGATLNDLIAFDHAMREHKLVTADVEKELYAPAQLTGGRCEGYGLGWVLSTYRGRPTRSHAGGIAGFSCFYGHVHDSDLTVIILSNRGAYDCMSLARRMIDMVVGDTSNPMNSISSSSTATEANSAAWSGIYADSPGDYVQVTFEAGRLILRREGAQHRMTPIREAAGEGHSECPRFVAEDDPEMSLRLIPGDATNPPAITITYPFTWFTGYRRPPAGPPEERDFLPFPPLALYRELTDPVFQT